MHCPSCQRENRADARFCDGCGAALVRACASCGRELRAGGRFCDGCGGQLDAEQWHHILDRFFQILTEGVHRFEGTVNQYTGDGLHPLGAELSALERAVRHRGSGEATRCETPCPRRPRS